jgi:hypothetical protein
MFGILVAAGWVMIVSKHSQVFIATGIKKCYITD